MKLPAMLTTKRLVIALLLLHVIPLAVTFYGRTLLTQALPFVWLLALPCVAYMLYKQKDSLWRSENGAQSSTLKLLLTTVLVFSLFLLMSWFVAQMSMQVQPVMLSAEGQGVLATVPASETLAYILRNTLQAWLLIIGIALAYNMMLKTNKSGFLGKRFDKLAIAAWLFDWVVYASMLLAIFSLMTFFVVNFGSSIVTLFGGDVVLMPMLSMVVFGMTFYMLNYFTQFGNKLRIRAKEKLSFAGVLFWQTGFAVLAWLVSAVFMTLLPNTFLYELHQPFYFSFMNIERYMQGWNFLILSWPFFLAPILGVYLAKYAAGQKVLSSILVFVAVPVMIAMAVLAGLPSVTTAFLEWQPVLTLQEIALNNDTARFRISIATIVFMSAFAILLFAIKCSKCFSESLVTVMPDRYGRREYRGRQLLAHFFLVFAAYLMTYLVMGVYGLFFTAAVYFLSVLLSIGMIYYKGITQQNGTTRRVLNVQTHEAVS